MLADGPTARPALWPERPVDASKPGRWSIVLLASKSDQLVEIRLCKTRWSRVIAQIVGIRHAKVTNDTTVYDHIRM